jgi:cadmium resistance protein CadD (predicted permease)
VLGTVLLAVTAFASTNVDDALLLLAFFADRRVRAGHVVAGQYLGMAMLTAVAAGLALLTWAVPARTVGLMGLIPILLGAHRLRANRRQGRSGAFGAEAVKVGAWGGALSVAGVTIANGGDNIAVYVPLLARRPPGEILLVCAVFAVLVAVWCGAARWLVSHRRFEGPVRRWGAALMPFVLIAIGCFILLRTGALDWRQG